MTSSSTSATLSSSGANDGGVDDKEDAIDVVDVTECLVIVPALPWKLAGGGLITAPLPTIGSCFMANARSAIGGGETERDFVEVEGETEAVEVPEANWPRCLINMSTIESLSFS